MANISTWLSQQKEDLTRRCDRFRDDVIEGLLENAEKELRRREEEHQAELKKREEKERVISERLNDEFVKNARLTEENSILLHRLERLEQKMLASTNPGPASRPSHRAHASHDDAGATVSKEEYHDLVQRFEDLHKRHQEAMQRIKYLERKNVTVMQKNKEMKESVRAWQRYSDRNHAKEQRLKVQAKQKEDSAPPAATNQLPPRPAIPSSPVSSGMKSPPPLHPVERSPGPISLAAPIRRSLDNRQSPDPRHHDGASAHADVDELPHSFQPHLDHQQGPLEDAEMATIGDELPSISNADQSSARITSSQTEYDENETAAELMPPPPNPGSDDTPEVVSERSLKRKRKDPIYNDPIGTPKNPVRVKEEQFSSPPAPLTAHKLLRKETFDLDELGPRPITTPRRKRFRNPVRPATLRHQRSISEPFIKEENLQEVQGGTTAAGLPASHIEDALEVRAYSEPFGQEQEQQPELAPDPPPLRPIDANTRMTARNDEHTPLKRRKRDDAAARYSEKFNLLTESGEELPPLYGKSGRLRPEAARAKINQKIRAAKHPRTPASSASKTPTTARSNIENVEPTTSDIDDTPAPAKFAPVLQPRKNPNSEPKHSPSKHTSAQRPIRLRDKPVHELKLSDFKANPKYNQGYSYAFAETVRKRADRACLPGCTREECCGSTFRSLADAAAPLSASQEEALLEDYLGDAYDTLQLTQMTPSERRELVLQARTRDFANKYGRHRQAYERHNTPPGFWRVDFPSTQEEREDVEKAKALERKVVAERRAEAMRRGGRWIFRDE
ncbi:SAE2-domain-containing protein [Westerdykella ornata]|uniref:SAE2-domain-containing protein n=1 Tax=Westerdykella ornata TaxID=318751 RepID=A0A6A6JC48_WESOR|nr:SAE2-domain-containing protein [Westerdykella ornata]KAF2274190.1 SAE2-domain-containing protein [Westerdykella ornata]